MKKEGFYLDTSIWLDVYEKRGENGKTAFKLIEMIVQEDLIIGYSSLNIKELKDLGYNQEEINEIFRVAKPGKLRKLHIFKEQIKEANKIAMLKNLPRKDVLQAILSRDNNFQFISRDEHFNQLRGVTIAKIPEDFI